ncbi:MAG TPA: hypothetical protein VI076_07320, partial [Actinopolymorphaceae bacterium]
MDAGLLFGVLLWGEWCGVAGCAGVVGVAGGCGGPTEKPRRHNSGEQIPHDVAEVNTRSRARSAAVVTAPIRT